MAAAGLLAEQERLRLEWVPEPLKVTRDRLTNFACHGLHQRAMVYRREAVRHERTLKPQLPQEKIDVVVESQAIYCFRPDAFRFFAAKTRPLWDRLIIPLRTTLVAYLVFGLVMETPLGELKTPPQGTAGGGTRKPTNPRAPPGTTWLCGRFPLAALVGITRTVTDPRGEHDDWIELRNLGEEEVDLSGLYLTDDPENPRKWPFPEGTKISGHEHLLVWADEDGLSKPGLDANFKLSALGEQVLLVDRDAYLNAMLDSVTLGPLGRDVAYGRPSSAPATFVILPATPGTPNP